jgi:hypothetical protein
MADPLDTQLMRLPDELPAPGLTTRIVAAVAQRRRTLAVWQGLGYGMLVCGLVGAVLIYVSWPVVAASASAALSAPATNYVTGLLNAPGDTLMTWLDSGLAWQATQADGIGAAFALGVALLAIAAFGGLARAVRNRPSTQIYSL